MLTSFLKAKPMPPSPSADDADELDELDELEVDRLEVAAAAAAAATAALIEPAEVWRSELELATPSRAASTISSDSTPAAEPVAQAPVVINTALARTHIHARWYRRCASTLVGVDRGSWGAGEARRGEARRTSSGKVKRCASVTISKGRVGVLVQQHSHDLVVVVLACVVQCRAQAFIARVGIDACTMTTTTRRRRHDASQGQREVEVEVGASNHHHRTTRRDAPHWICTRPKTSRHVGLVALEREGDERVIGGLASDASDRGGAIS